MEKRTMNEHFLLIASVLLFFTPRACGQLTERTPVPAVSHQYIDTLTNRIVVDQLAVPSYPPLALQARISGMVKLRVGVEDGAVRSAEPISSAHILLSNAAVENVRSWRFPAPIGGDLLITFIYEIESEDADYPQNPRIELELPSLVRITARAVKPRVLSDPQGTIVPSSPEK